MGTSKRSTPPDELEVLDDAWPPELVATMVSEAPEHPAETKTPNVETSSTVVFAPDRMSAVIVARHAPKQAWKSCGSARHDADMEARMPFSMRDSFAKRSCFVVASAALFACGSAASEPPGSGGGASASASSGAGGSSVSSKLATVLGELRAHPDRAMKQYASSEGWPVSVEGGRLFVSVDPERMRLAGDHDAWTGTAMMADAGFAWLVVDVPPGDHYKFTNGTDYSADPYARSYGYDSYGEMSFVAPKFAHFDRWIDVGDDVLERRNLRIRVPSDPVGRVIYVHDGQNLFDPAAPIGGWHLDAALPADALAVGIDNTPERMDEYTQAEDDIGSGPIGGKADLYGHLLEQTIRPLIRANYGETGPIGIMGSSLGGLVSLYLADAYPGHYAFAASLSGTMGWGSIGPGVHATTMIELAAQHGHQSTVLYVDSGGDGACVDADHDGVDDDDPNATDNYCENAQLFGVLKAHGYVEGVDLTYAWDKGAPHNEAAWSARLALPMKVFGDL